MSQALLGQVVGVLEARDGFARIETPDRYAGWVAGGGAVRVPRRAGPALRGPAARWPR